MVNHICDKKASQADFRLKTIQVQLFESDLYFNCFIFFTKFASVWNKVKKDFFV